MSVEKMDLCGMKCPEPQMKIAVKALDMHEGSILEAVSDCETFEHDIRNWCKRANKTLLSVKDIGQGKKVIQIQF